MVVFFRMPRLLGRRQDGEEDPQTDHPAGSLQVNHRGQGQNRPLSAEFCRTEKAGIPLVSWVFRPFSDLLGSCVRGATRIRTGESRFCRPFPYHLGMAPKKGKDNQVPPHLPRGLLNPADFSARRRRSPCGPRRNPAVRSGRRRARRNCPGEDRAIRSGLPPAGARDPWRPRSKA
jgi:hypothetical protein